MSRTLSYTLAALAAVTFCSSRGLVPPIRRNARPRAPTEPESERGFEMSKLTSDPLLAAAKVILALGEALFVFVLAVVLLAIGAILTVRRGEILAELAAAWAPDGAYWAIVVALVLIGGVMVLCLR